jgi:hypothetical protein
MIESGARLPPLEAVRNELQKLRGNTWLKLSGNAGVVDMVDALLVSQDARITALETQVKQLQGMGGAVDEYAQTLRRSLALGDGGDL